MFALFATRFQFFFRHGRQNHLDLNPLNSLFWTYFQIAILYSRHPPHLPSKMAITILPPVVDDVDIPNPDSDHDSMSVDSDGGVDLEQTSRPSKRTRTVGGTKIGAGVVTPGEVVTDDPQWMRLVFFPLAQSAGSWKREGTNNL